MKKTACASNGFKVNSLRYVVCQYSGINTEMLNNVQIDVDARITVGVFCIRSTYRY